MKTQRLWLTVALWASIAISTGSASAQVSSNASLTGKYFFRQTSFATDAGGTVTETRSASGTLTFDGIGTFTITGQQLIGSAAAANLAGNGTYTVKPGGFMTMSNPIRANTTMNARLGAGAVTASTTEAGTVFDTLVAIQAPTTSVTAALLSGTYYLATLEFLDGVFPNVRNTFSPLTANGAGSFGNVTVAGQAANLANKLLSQTVSAASYTISPDGQGTANFPSVAGADPSGLLLTGTKSIAVSADGTYFIGGSMAGNGHGIVIGVKAPAGGGTNANWDGFFFGSGLRIEPGKHAAYVGAAFSTKTGSATWARRLRQFDAVLDASLLHPYSLTADASGTALGNRIAISSTGNAFVGSGVQASDSAAYEIYFGIRMPLQSGTGVFINPQGALNAASFAPPGYPVSPGGFITLFGSGFGTTTATATVPYPKILAGVTITVNNVASAIYRVLNGRVDFFIPYGVTGSTATIVLASGATKSNSIDIPLSVSAPGLFSLSQNGLGPAAVLHPDFSVVSAQNPAKKGETVQIFLAGLGATTPAVADGAAPPVAPPFALVTAPLQVVVGGVVATNVSFQGLSPGLPGLYQLNVQIPANAPSGQVPLQLLTGQAFSDMVDINVQ